MKQTLIVHLDISGASLKQLSEVLAAIREIRPIEAAILRSQFGETAIPVSAVRGKERRR